MGNQETKELGRIPSTLINGIYKATEDGDFDLLTDYQHFIGTLTSIQPGIKGIKAVKQENVEMTIEERDDFKDSLSAGMPDVPASDRYDLAAGMAGIFAIFRLAWRKGAENAEEALKDKIRNGEVTLEEILQEDKGES